MELAPLRELTNRLTQYMTLLIVSGDLSEEALLVVSGLQEFVSGVMAALEALSAES